ncbi:nucleoside-diphosphate-sugar epimerase [Purpureocillium lavendulum]|uniref:Nucleoside-diphosphate-sugar epimerase n=1 Tax=Purpureocillium lavendulum TaxID=1247861 RepID=A0AB34FX54_9HYPO|nr:nucleoside-diphosphate-sugar epimerase [Purpureocillium lavendulum]
MVRDGITAPPNGNDTDQGGSGDGTKLPPSGLPELRARPDSRIQIDVDSTGPASPGTRKTTQYAVEDKAVRWRTFMKVIVTGATGSAGRQVVQHCIENPRVTKVVVLTRTAVSGDVESHPKVEVVMHQDFSSYPEALLRRLEGSQACIWAIGGRIDQLKHDKSLCRQVVFELPLAAARAFSQHLAGKTPGATAFRFVFCSSKHAERAKKSFPFVNDPRRYVADAEKGLSEVADANKAHFEAYILRPARYSVSDVSPRQPTTPTKKTAGGQGTAIIDTAQVGKAMVAVALDGWKGRVVENDALLTM